MCMVHYSIFDSFSGVGPWSSHCLFSNDCRGDYDCDCRACIFYGRFEVGSYALG